MMKSVNVTGDTVDLEFDHAHAWHRHGPDDFAGSVAAGQQTSVRILPVNVYGNSETATSWNVALGVQAAVDGGATVLNMSMAGTHRWRGAGRHHPAGNRQGVLIFAAAGNQPVTTPNYPAAIARSQCRDGARQLRASSPRTPTMAVLWTWLCPEPVWCTWADQPWLVQGHVARHRLRHRRGGWHQGAPIAPRGQISRAPWSRNLPCRKKATDLPSGKSKI